MVPLPATKGKGSGPTLIETLCNWSKFLPCPCKEGFFR